MKSFLMLLMASVMLFTACDTMEPTNDLGAKDDSNGNITDVEYDSFFVPLDEALKSAETMYSTFYGKETRSFPKEVESVEIFNKRTRGEDNQDSRYGFYVVNFSDESGFALLSADRRRESVYGLSDHGSLHLSDTLWNGGLSWYLNECLPTINDVYVPPFDSIMIPKPFPGFGGPRQEESVYSEPLLKGILSRMSQGYPMNRYCFTPDNMQAPTGCLPLAVGSIMAYNKWPVQYKDLSLDWDQMLDDIYDLRWALFMRELGKDDLLSANYKTNGTSASMRNVVRTFSRMGYTGAVYTDDCFNRFIPDELRKKQPVVVCGDGVDYNGAHAWVIDGGRCVTLIQMISNEEVRDSQYYYHCLWGHGTNANGYFLYSNSQLGGTPDSKWEHEYGSSYVYCRRDYIYGYRPNKK